MKKVINNKKILFSIIGIILIIVIIVLVNSFTAVKEHKDSKKMKTHLESVGYNCVTYNPDNTGDICDYCYYCTNTTNNGINQVIQIDYRDNDVIYKESVYDSYEFSVSSSDYNSSSKRTQKVLYNDLIDNKKFNFEGKAKNYFVVGENVDCDDYKYGESKMICQDIINDVNASMRLFESYYSNAGIELGK